MRVRMFKPRFAVLVAAGTKRQTIRPMPKRMPKVGDHESWRRWSGLPYRSKQIELARVEIVSVERIRIEETSDTYDISLLDRPLKGALLPKEHWDEIAVADGFANQYGLAIWFKETHGLPFGGIIIRAKDL